MTTREKPRALTQKETATIAEFAHSEFLRVLMLEDSISVDDIVFHGETSLRLIHKSSRYSEDLDFMIQERIIPELNSLLPKVVQDVATGMRADIPNLEIQWKSKMKPDTNMMVGMMSLKNPLWHKDVKVKVECYPAHDMSHYMTSKLDIGDSNTVVPTATLESIMGDKLVALAKRPYFKERDAYDVWWLTKKGIEPSIEYIENSCMVYGYDPQEIVELLGSIHDRIGDPTVLENDLKKWLPDDLHTHFKRHNIFEQIQEATINACMTCHHAMGM